MPCSVAIRSARAVVEEVPEASSSSINSMAACSLGNPERAVHRLADKYRLCLPLPLTDVNLGEYTVPVLMMSDWAKYLLGKNLMHSFCGLSNPNPQRMMSIWETFWERFRGIQPNHPVFSRGDISLGRTVGLLLHGDEGRSQKKAAMMCVSAHSALGYGLSTSKVNKKPYLAMKLNYEKPTWTTRFLLSVLPKHVYGDDDGEDNDVFQDLLLALSQDLRRLWEEGLVGADNQRYHFVVIYTMGDWPFHLKAACFQRSFHNAAKHATSQAAPKGICHMCKADLPGFPWEDWQSDRPSWMES